MLTATAVGVACALCLAAGFYAGLAIHGWLAFVYKRSSNLAVQSAYNDAYRDFTDKFNKNRDKANAIENGPHPRNADEETMGFEESIENLYPGDKEKQQKARDDRGGR